MDGNPRLSQLAHSALTHPSSEVYLSAASAWEIVLKYGKGQLALSATPEEFVSGQRDLHGINSLPMAESATLGVLQLPGIHRDPFDRIIIAQAITEGMLIVTSDGLIRRYPVGVVW